MKNTSLVSTVLYGVFWLATGLFVSLYIYQRPHTWVPLLFVGVWALAECWRAWRRKQRASRPTDQ